MLAHGNISMMTHDSHVISMMTHGLHTKHKDYVSTWQHYTNDTMLQTLE